MSFDIEQWLSDTKQIPQEHILTALQSVVDRKKALDDLPRITTQAIETATQYHAAVDPTVEKIDGVPVWVKPVADFAAYPPGAQVAHDGKVWTQQSAAITSDEPGTTAAWATQPQKDGGENE